MKEGREHGQAVGYLDDGTMVVVEDAVEKIGQEVDARVRNVIQTATGRMIFASLPGHQRDRPWSDRPAGAGGVCDASPMDEGRAVAVILAAGAGRRVGAEIPKAFLPIGERPMLAVAAATAAASPAIHAIVATAPPGLRGRGERLPGGAAGRLHGRDGRRHPPGLRPRRARGDRAATSRSW